MRWAVHRGCAGHCSAWQPGPTAADPAWWVYIFWPSMHPLKPCQDIQITWQGRARGSHLHSSKLRAAHTHHHSITQWHACCLPPISAGEAEGSYFHSSKLVTTASCNVQTIGRDVLYTPRIETRLKTGAWRCGAVSFCVCFKRSPEGVAGTKIVVGRAGGWPGKPGSPPGPIEKLCCCPSCSPLQGGATSWRLARCSASWERTTRTPSRWVGGVAGSLWVGELEVPARWWRLGGGPATAAHAGAVFRTR